MGVEFGGHEGMRAALGQRDHPRLRERRPVLSGSGVAELRGVRGRVRTSSSNPSIASSRQPRLNDPPAVPSASNPAVGPVSPATGPQVRSNNSGNTPRPRRLRACLIALAVGTDQDASQQPNRSSDPVTLAATSS
jgi:hypothetical protein